MSRTCVCVIAVCAVIGWIPAHVGCPSPVVSMDTDRVPRYPTHGLYQWCPLPLPCPMSVCHATPHH